MSFAYNVINNVISNVQIEKFKNNRCGSKVDKKKLNKKSNNNASFRKSFVSDTNCSANRNTNSSDPEPNDPNAESYESFSYLGSCEWDKFDNMSLSSSKLGSCSGCPVNSMGIIDGDRDSCKSWCSSVPGCTAFTMKNNKCALRTQAYYTKPTMDEDTYLKKAGSNNEWIEKKNQKIPNDFRNRKKAHQYNYNNLSTQKIEDGYPYYPQPYLKGLSPDFPTFKNSSVKQCKEVCANDPECGGVTFNHRNNDCTLKRNVLNGDYNTQKSKGHTTFVCEKEAPYHNKFPKDWY